MNEIEAKSIKEVEQAKSGKVLYAICPMKWGQDSPYHAALDARDYHSCALRPNHKGKHTCDCGETYTATPSVEIELNTMPLDVDTKDVIEDALFYSYGAFVEQFGPTSFRMWKLLVALAKVSYGLKE